GTCGGTSNIAIPLLSDIYLTGPTDGLVPCPRCAGGARQARPHNGQPRTPRDPAGPRHAPPPSPHLPPAARAVIRHRPPSLSADDGDVERDLDRLRLAVLRLLRLLRPAVLPQLRDARTSLYRGQPVHHGCLHEVPAAELRRLRAGSSSEDHHGGVAGGGVHR